jgi:pyruvate kinase
MRELVRIIRDIEREYGRPMALVDLQGPKLRIGTFKDDAVMLAAGANFVLDADPAPGDCVRSSSASGNPDRSQARPHAAAR